MPTESNHDIRAHEQDLLRLLEFNPQQGYIGLGGRRVMLMRSETFEGQRAELIEELGAERARSLYSRLGYADGTRDAGLAQQQRPDAALDEAFLVGPELHAVFGMAAVETVTIKTGDQQQSFYGEFLARGSIEADAHQKVYGLAPEPVCWMQSGYASGFASAFVGSPILFREVECMAMGDEACRLVGKPLAAWREQDPDAAYFHPLEFVNRFEPAEIQAETSDVEAALGQRVVGISAAFSLIMSRLKKVAPTQATVLLQGETGVGKEVFAKTLHRVSANPDGPFVGVNCAALPADLVEAELFGVERGGFTGAVNSRPGRFERADGGTLFLDEIGTLSFSAQGKLLRALQEREIERVGGTETRPVNTRVVAASNIDLFQAVEEGRFRRDLYYRLSVFPLQIPPLRERKEDIPLLMEYFRQKYTARHGIAAIGFTPQAVAGLMNYQFPGNIRELENMVERGVILAAGASLIGLHDLLGESELQQYLLTSKFDESSEQGPMERFTALLSADVEALPDIKQMERVLIDLALQKSGGNLAAAARLIGLTRRQFAYRVAQGASPGN
ncbi:MAG: sigma-54-dependent Fis family transcriptional regulator [Gammaproteobacteria bacterium]|nr:MAG: sigma-54-dependent Fis family transcriptional regulator [Gammaproteobacteria bacterium]RLA13512.1 MAG: sigma-54-dependent Fis family transcriptional regulator [Gammaproteobacteria bacterium]